jgi:phosphatidylglycerophosphatase C
VARNGDRDVAKANLVARVLQGMQYEQVAARGQIYAVRVVERGLRPEAVARVRWHQDEGHEVVIVSASLETYLHPVGELLGVRSVLCTTLEVDAHGTITGQSQGGNCRGPEKVARLRGHLAGAPATIWAYGDSSGDDDLLAMADRAYRVTRRGEFVEAPARPSR